MRRANLTPIERDLPSADAVLAKARGENFPVASRLLPRRVRKDLLALYGFARLVDDVGDEGGDRAVEMLDAASRELELVFTGEPAHPVMQRLVGTVRDRDLPVEPFRRLIEANRRDQIVRRYATFEDLLGYCRLSADPVGELVLRVLEKATPERLRLSGRVCTALQLVDHIQDVKEDYARGRVYLPLEDLDRFGVDPSHLGRDVASAPVRRMIAFSTQRSARLLSEGTPLIASLRGRARWGVAAFVAGGAAALRAVERAGFDVLRSTPRPTRLVIARSLVSVLVMWGENPRSPRAGAP